MTVDPHTVLAGGQRRRRRRRRLAAVAGTAAAAVALGIGGGVVLSNPPRADDRVLPATSSSPTSAMGVGEVEIPLDGSPTGGVARVRVDEPGRRVAWQVVADGGVVDAGEFGLPGSWGGGTTATWAEQPVESGVVVGVLPGPVAAATATWTGGPLESPVRTMQVPRTAYFAFASWNAAGIPDGLLTGVTWVSSDLAYGGLGTDLPTLAVDRVVGFVDPTRDLVGVSRDGGMAVERRADADVDGLSVVTLRLSPTDGSDYRVTTLVVLPVGATLDDVTATGPDPLAVSSLRELVVFGSGSSPPFGSGFVVRRDTATELPGTGIETVRWTDHSGTPHVTDLSGVG